MTTKAQFIADIDAYLVQSGMTETDFSRRSCNNPSFVFRLRKGADVTLSTVDRVRRFMADNPSPQRSEVKDVA